MPRFSLEKLCRMMAENSTIDEETARIAYIALVRTITKQLREHRRIGLHKLGVMKLHTIKGGERKVSAGRYGVAQKKWVPTHTYLKFTPHSDLKEYFRSMGTGMERDRNET